MTVKPPFLTRVYNVIFYGVASLVVIAAVLLTVVRGLLANVESYRTDIEQLASTSLGQAVNVKVGSLDAGFSGITPTLIARDIRFIAAAEQVEIVNFTEAEIGVSLIESIRNNRLIPNKVVVKEIELVVTRFKDKSIHVLGLDITNLESDEKRGLQDTDLTDWLFQHTNLALKDSTIIWRDLNKDEKGLRFEDVNVLLKNDGQQHNLQGYINLPKEVGEKLDVAFSINGDMRFPASWQGKMYLNARQLSLNQLEPLLSNYNINFKRGRADIALWANVESGRLSHLSGELMLNNISVDAGQLSNTLELGFIGGLFKFENAPDGWNLAVDQFQASSGSRIWPVSRFNLGRSWHEGKKSSDINVAADYFRLEDLFFFVNKLKAAKDKKFPDFLKARPSGDIIQLRLSLSEKENNIEKYQLQTRFKQLSMLPAGKLPGLRGVNGAVWLDEKHGEVNLSSRFANLNFPKLFEGPLTLTELDSVFNWEKKAKSWQVWSDDIIAKNNDISTLSQMQLEIPANGTSPFMDLQVSFMNGNARQAKKYFPYGIMPEGLVNWVKNSTMSGKVVDGGVVFRGRFSDFPFLQPTGQFKVEFTGRNMGLEYMPGWPVARQANVFARFDSRGLGFDLSKLKILNTKSRSARVYVPEFKHAHLKIDGELSGPVKDLFTYVVETPIQPQAKKLLDSAIINGHADTKLHIDLPLSQSEIDISALNFKGESQINNGALSLWNKKVDITGISGHVNFSDKEYKARNVQGLLFGRKAEFDIFTRRENDSKLVSIVSRSSIDIAEAVKKLGYQPGNKVSGVSAWQGLLNFRGTTETGIALNSLSLRSDLLGVSSQLPTPLNKQENDTRELSVQIHFAHNNSYTLAANYNNEATLASRQTDSKLEKLSVHFGSEAAVLSENNIMRLTGVANNISLKAWLKALQEINPGSGQSRQVLPVEFAMDKLIIDKDETTTLSTPKYLIHPSEIPLIYGHVNQFSYHGIELGKMTLKTSRLKKGIRFDHIEFNAPPHHFFASGEWRQGLLGDTSQLDVKIKSDDVEHLLSKFGYSAVITGGKLELQGNFAWPDRPEQFSLKTAMGKLDFNIQDGRIVEVDAGAGRLLGLFSITALPRRLALDFKDAFQSGFSFDTMQGDIELKDGNAYSNDVSVKSPVATILVNGRTDYIKQTFDQRVVVTPKIGNTLPLAGGLIFGLEIGAAIALIDTIMGKDIDKASKREYHITGNWDNPVITEIKKKKAVEENFQEDSTSDDEV